MQGVETPSLCFWGLLEDTLAQAPQWAQLGKRILMEPGLPLEQHCKKLDLLPDDLAIYRWVAALLQLDPSCPLQPLFWQMFFSLYFDGVKLEPGQAPSRAYRCFGVRALGTSKAILRAQLTERLTACAAVWKGKALANGNNSALGTFSSQTYNRFLVLQRCFEDPRYQSVFIDLSTEGIEMEVLMPFFTGSALEVGRSHEVWWVDPEVQFPEANALDQLQQHLRVLGVEQHPLRAPAAAVARASWKQLAQGGANSQEDAQTAKPQLQAIALVSPVTFTCRDTEQTVVDALEPVLAHLQSAAVEYETALATQTALDEEFLSLLSSLYRNRQVDRVLEQRCTEQECRAPALINLSRCEAQLDGRKQEQLQQNRASTTTLLQGKVLGVGGGGWHWPWDKDNGMERRAVADWKCSSGI